MFNRIQLFFERVVDRVENNSTPFRYYLFLYLAILSVRLTLEFFSSRRLFVLDDLLHIGLWFTFIVLAFIMQLSLFSGERIVKVAKLSIVFFSLALTAPIVDLLLSGGVGAKMNYLSLNSWGQIAWSYATIGGSSLTRGATPGIRLEIALMLLACFNYVRTKRGNWIKALLAVCSIYTVLFLSGAVPFLLGFIVQAFKLTYQTEDQSTVLLLLTFDVLLGLFACLIHGRRSWFLLLKNIPWTGFFLSIAFFLLGSLLAIKWYPTNFMLSPTTIFWFPLLLELLCCFCVLAGSMRINLLQPQEEQLFTRLSGMLVLLIFIISGMISVKLLFTAALCWALLFLLYEHPLRLTQIPVVGNVLQVAFLLAVAFAGFGFFRAPMIGFPVPWLWSILLGGFLLGFAREWNWPLKTHRSLRFTSQISKQQFQLMKGLLMVLAFGLVCVFLSLNLMMGIVFFLLFIPSLVLVAMKPERSLWLQWSFCLPAVGLLILAYFL